MPLDDIAAIIESIDPIPTDEQRACGHAGYEFPRDGQFCPRCGLELVDAFGDPL